MSLTDEQMRILTAARDGRLRTDERHYWYIEGEERPMSHERVRLRNVGLLANVAHMDGFMVGALTDAGRAALEAARV